MNTATQTEANTLSDGTTWENCRSLTHKHPSGGALTIKAHCGHSADFTDTRRLHRNRKPVRGIVYQCGIDGWCVVQNPGESHKVLGCFKTTTAAGAIELATA